MDSIGNLDKQKKAFQRLKLYIQPIKGKLSSIEQQLNKKDNFSGVDKITNAITDIGEALTALGNITSDLDTASDNVQAKIDRIEREQKAKEEDESADEEDKGDK